MQPRHHILLANRWPNLVATILLACATAASAAATPTAPSKAPSAAPAKAPSPAEIQALASRKACLNCHNIDRKVIGPAFKDVAQRYRKQKDAEQKLVAKVLKGGGGAWGPVAMPANPQVDEAQARQLVHWVLGLK